MQNLMLYSIQALFQWIQAVLELSKRLQAFNIIINKSVKTICSKEFYAKFQSRHNELQLCKYHCFANIYLLFFTIMLYFVNSSCRMQVHTIAINISLF